MKSKKVKKSNSKIGLVICIIQILITIAFIAGVIVLGLLPFKYVLPNIVVLTILCIIPLCNQLMCKKRVASGRVLSIFMSVILLTGSIYVAKAHGMVNNISGGDGKVDKIVVAVLEEDSAKKLKDTVDYSFGVQYVLKGQEIKDTVKEINEELNEKIDTVEYSNLNEQVKSLYDKDVEAIIYDSAYMPIIKESYPDFETRTRVIYEHEIAKRNEKPLEVTVNIEEPFTVYLSGIDVAGAIETTGRSDVNILAVVNPTTHQVLLITTPRDYHVLIPGISNGMEDKLTHAGIYGVDASMATLSYLYDVEVDYYVRVNFTSLPQMVDALGGIEVESDYEFTTHPDSGEVMHVKKGMNTFNGKQALVFARERQNVPGGDFQRGKDQQKVITAMLRKAVSPAILAGAFDIIDSVSENVDTNMTSKFIRSLVKSQISNPSAWSVTSMAAEGEPDMGRCFSASGMDLSICRPDYESVEKIKTAIDKVEAGEPLEDVEIIEQHTEQ